MSKLHPTLRAGLSRLKRLVVEARRENASLKHSIPSNTSGSFQLGKSMIVRIQGGLCNQLMCYKAGRILSDLYDANLVLLASEEQCDKSRTFFLDRYPIRYSLLTSCPEVQSRILSSNDIFVVEREHLFDQDYRRISGQQKAELFGNIAAARMVCFDIFLSLYLWRLDEEYRASSKILDEITLPADKYLSDHDRSVLDRIYKSENAVAVHVRRGDFLSPEYDLGVRPEYYRDAIGFLLQRLHDPDFFIFSDDIPWCRTHIGQDHAVNFVDHNNALACTNDLFLGSQCRHFILTNHSTFSHHMAELARPGPTSYILTNSKRYLVTSRIIDEYYTPRRCTSI